jgi:hypothetical protein
MRRWIFFTLAILTGIVIGLFYGWVLQPVQYTDTSLKNLGIEYKTDYVLMVAEAYHFDYDSIAAVNRLTRLDSGEILDVIHQAILYAEEAGYNNRDLELMRALQTATIFVLPTMTP